MSECKGAVHGNGRCRRPLERLSNEHGMAMLTVVMVLLILTVLGIAAITVTGMENKMAGLQRTMEASAQAAECRSQPYSRLVGADLVMDAQTDPNQRSVSNRT